MNDLFLIIIGENNCASTAGPTIVSEPGVLGYKEVSPK